MAQKHKPSFDETIKLIKSEKANGVTYKVVDGLIRAYKVKNMDVINALSVLSDSDKEMVKKMIEQGEI